MRKDNGGGEGEKEEGDDSRFYSVGTQRGRRGVNEMASEPSQFTFTEVAALRTVNAVDASRAGSDGSGFPIASMIKSIQFTRDGFNSIRWRKRSGLQMLFA